MFRSLYRLLLIASWSLLALGLVVSLAFSNPKWATLGAVVTGLGASLLASTYIQRFASEEQSTLLRELTLSADGIAALPEDFRHLKWTAYSTRVSDGKGGKRVEWVVAPMQRVQTRGRTLAQYQFETRTPDGKPALYSLTLLGLTGCVVGLSAKGRESREIVSVSVYDVPVEDAGTYFAVGYLTDWLGERALSLEIVGATNVPSSVTDLPHDVLDRFRRWYDKVDWSVASSIDDIQRPTP